MSNTFARKNSITWQLPASNQQAGKKICILVSVIYNLSWHFAGNRKSGTYHVTAV